MTLSKIQIFFSLPHKFCSILFHLIVWPVQVKNSYITGSSVLEMLTVITLICTQSYQLDYYDPKGMLDTFSLTPIF